MASKKVIVDNLSDSTVEILNDEVVWLLRRMVKLLEGSATVDTRNRQRVVLDGIGTGTTGITTELAAVLPVALNSVSAAGAANTPYTSLPGAIVGSIAPHAVAEGPVDQRWRVAEDAHISYQLGIRNKLTFS